MENPFFTDGVLDVTASINKVVIGKMPTRVVKQDLLGKSALTFFSTNLLIEAIKENADRLSLDLRGMQEKMLPHYLEECLSSDSEIVRKTAKEILRIFGERLAVILLCLKMGEEPNRRARADWNGAHWAYWKQIDTIILTGGLANSYLGETLKYYAEKVFFDAKEEGYRLICGNDTTYAGLKGCVSYLTETTCQKVNLIFDFGQTFTKRSYVQKNEQGTMNVRILDNILSKHVEWDVVDRDLEQKEAVLLQEAFFEIIKRTIKEVEEKGLLIGKEIIISIANYVKDGKLANRGGYGKLRLLADNYEQFLEEKLLQDRACDYKIKLVHDGTAMAAGYRDYPNAACISLGTAFGVGFPIP